MKIPFRFAALPLAATFALPLCGTIPALAKTSPDPAECAALWYGMLDLSKDYPGIFGDMSDTKALADGFAKQAGPDAVDHIADRRKVFEGIAKGKVILQEKISTKVFDDMAARCASLEKTEEKTPAPAGDTTTGNPSDAVSPAPAGAAADTAAPAGQDPKDTSAGE